MIINDTKLASFKSMVKNFADKNDIRYEIATSVGKKTTEVILGTPLRHRKYTVTWTDVPSLSDAAANIFGDAIAEFKLNDNVTSAFKNPAFEIKNVIFNNPATIVLWEDGTKTVVKCQDGDIYNEEMGLALCIAKKALGNQSNFNNVFKKLVPEKKSPPDTFTITIDDPYADRIDFEKLAKKFNERLRNFCRGGENV